MYRFLFFLIVSSFLFVPVWAQEEYAEPDETETPEPQVEEIDETETPEPQAEEIDESGLDEQGFTDEDDDFRPSEDIPADQSIPFPTDI